MMCACTWHQRSTSVLHCTPLSLCLLPPPPCSALLVVRVGAALLSGSLALLATSLDAVLDVVR